MHGAGTKTDTTTNNANARLLDLTRLISRVGRGPMTGVDRVEFAYLRHMLGDTIPLYSLVRTTLGGTPFFALMERARSMIGYVVRRRGVDLTFGRDCAGVGRRFDTPQRRMCVDIQSDAHGRGDWRVWSHVPCPKALPTLTWVIQT